VATIRKAAERADWAFVRDLCARTGNAGSAIEPSRNAFFSELWVGPYEKLRPNWTYLAVAEGAKGAGSVGYLTGAPDTRRFLRERRWLFELPLYLRAACGGYGDSRDARRFRDRFLGRERGPEESFDEAATAKILEEFPAHLHMNLEASARGEGVGRKLVARFQSDLGAAGIRGIHIYCGDVPLPFYRRLGFAELDRIEFRPGVPVYRLGSRF
jgi:GNAT superfamily N-acetyltransferase